MPLYAWVLIIAAALYGLHRLALWMERRGWIYYVKRQPSVSTLGTAALSVQSILEPDKKHVLEMMQQRRKERDDQDEPPDPTASESSSHE